MVGQNSRLDSFTDPRPSLIVVPCSGKMNLRQLSVGSPAQWKRSHILQSLHRRTRPSTLLNFVEQFCNRDMGHGVHDQVCDLVDRLGTYLDFKHKVKMFEHNHLDRVVAMPITVSPFRYARRLDRNWKHASETETGDGTVVPSKSDLSCSG